MIASIKAFFQAISGFDGLCQPCHNESMRQSLAKASAQAFRAVTNFSFA
jgi:hypothetical protein